MRSLFNSEEENMSETACIALAVRLMFRLEFLYESLQYENDDHAQEEIAYIEYLMDCVVHGTEGRILDLARVRAIAKANPNLNTGESPVLVRVSTGDLRESTEFSF